MPGFWIIGSLADGALGGFPSLKNKTLRGGALLVREEIFRIASHRRHRWVNPLSIFLHNAEDLQPKVKQK